jgi:threonyl-tRNA synthetase
MQKIPYMLIIGEKEADSQVVSVRKHGHGDVGSFSLDQFLNYFNTELEA